jgi:hypothetical protein
MIRKIKDRIQTSAEERSPCVIELYTMIQAEYAKFRENNNQATFDQNGVMSQKVDPFSVDLAQRWSLRKILIY